MSLQPQIQQYLNSLIEPLHIKLEQLQRQNQSLKLRVSHLESHYAAQNNSKSYMRNTTSRDNHLLEKSKVTRKDDDGRSVSGSREKQGWQRSTKIGDDKPIVHETTHYYQRARLKPPIPRMNSRTPTKNSQEEINREKSPTYNQLNSTKNIILTSTSDSSPIQNKKSSQNLVSPRNTTHQFDNPSVSHASKNLAMKLGKPNIYIQKQAKLNTVSATSPRKSPLNQSTMTEIRAGGGSQVVIDNLAPNLDKSQLSINSDKKAVKVEAQS